MNDEQFKTITDKLDKVLRLLALETVKGHPHEQDKVDLLDSIGFRPSEIDRLLGKNAGYAAAALGNIRKKEREKVSSPDTTAPESATEKK